MLDVLSGFVGALREAGLPVSLTEAVDAAEAVTTIPIEDRELFKAVLGATLVKSDAYWPVFDVVFEVYFALRGAEHVIEEPAGPVNRATSGAPDGHDGLGPGRVARGAEEGLTAEELAGLLYEALIVGDAALLGALARRAVSLFAGMERGRPVGGSYYLFRTLRALDTDGLAARMMEAARASAPGEMTALDERLAADDHRARLAHLRREVEAEIRRRLVGDRGARAVATTLRRPLPEDVDFMHATADELAGLRRAIYPLTRKLAARLARRRRQGRNGPLDFRATVRHSLSYGGVPVEPRFRRPTPSKPEIVVIADISGSVAAFARFTLQLVYAISSQFSRVRSFVFIDGIDEVTRVFEGSDDLGEALAAIGENAEVVWVDGHSNYGHAFEVFWDRWGDSLSPRSSVIILGDARNNYHTSSAWVVAEIRTRVRGVWWLNPEPRAYWDTGDSIASEYAAKCDGAFECRNLRQLEHFVEQLA